MVYDYVCTNEDCDGIQEETHSMNGFKEFHPNCVQCGSPCNYQWTPSIPQVVFKDGPSGSWPSKGEHYKQYRAKRNEEMKKRQRDRYGHLRRDAVPNLDGQEKASWREAQADAIREKGMEVASTFTSKIAEEKAKSKKIVI